jgi:anti-sigma factor RsiW
MNRNFDMRLLPRAHLRDEQLVALLDDELPLDESAGVQRHLADCDQCADLLARQDRAHRALAAEWAAALIVGEPALPAVDTRWRLRPAVGAAGAGVLAGAVGMAVVAGLLARRGRRLLAA